MTDHHSAADAAVIGRIERYIKVPPENSRIFTVVPGVATHKHTALSKAMGEIASIQAASSGRVHDVVRAAIYVKAWNLVAEGKKGRGATDLRWSTSEDFPVTRP